MLQPNVWGNVEATPRFQGAEGSRDNYVTPAITFHRGLSSVRSSKGGPLWHSARVWREVNVRGGRQVSVLFLVRREYTRKLLVSMSSHFSILQSRLDSKSRSSLWLGINIQSKGRNFGTETVLRTAELTNDLGYSLGTWIFLVENCRWSMNRWLTTRAAITDTETRKLKRGVFHPQSLASNYERIPKLRFPAEIQSPNNLTSCRKCSLDLFAAFLACNWV